MSWHPLLLCACVALGLCLPCSAGWFPNPFEGSNCSCTTFCDDNCSINATSPRNISTYRMTPNGVVDLTNKNTGDVFGDVGFVLSRRTTAFYCRQNPKSFHCTGMTQFDGDDDNSTDLVLQLKVEVDGEWGPYLFCNPTNSTEPQGPWGCVARLNYTEPSPAGFPPSCSAQHFNPYSDTCWTASAAHTKVITNVDASGCCTEATSGGFVDWTYFKNNRSCSLYEKGIIGDHDWVEDKKCISGDYRKPDPPACECPRMQKTVGLWQLERDSYFAAGGYWYSFPGQGECKEGGYVGDGSGCSWRLVAITKAIHASCMYQVIDHAVENRNSSCFSPCPRSTLGGYNRTSACYLECYSHTTAQMSPEQLAVPWNQAFAGSCPLINATHG